jgi:hypothetical protein
MDGGVEEPLAPTFGALAVAGILWNAGDHAGIEDALPIMRGVKAAIEVEIGASEVHPDFFGHLLQGGQALWEQDHIGCIDGRHGDWRYDVAMVIRDRDDFLPLLVFVAGVADPIAPFLATVLVPVGPKYPNVLLFQRLRTRHDPHRFVTLAPSIAPSSQRGQHTALSQILGFCRKFSFAAICDMISLYDLVSGHIV